MRILQSLLFTSLLTFPFLSNAATCPTIKDLVRTQGEYSWFSNTPGWEGGYIAPTPGKGSSTFLSHFVRADWVQLNNKSTSLGYVVCNYKGNYGDEVIRFTQTETKKGRHEKEIVSKKPVGVSWDCKIQPDYPSTACTCSGQIDHCTFTPN